MSSTPTRTVRGTPGQGTENRTVDCETEISTLLAALEDDDCRAILDATSERPRSAGELSELCDISSSTTYRKVDDLTEAGLLEEQVRLSTNGTHTSEYSLAVRSIEITLDDGIELSMSATGDGGPLARAD